MPSVPSCTVINEQTGVITRTIDNAAKTTPGGLVFENKKSLLLHSQHISAPVKFSKSIPLNNFYD